MRELIADFVQNGVRVLGTVPRNPTNSGITPTPPTTIPARLAAGILRETAFVLDFEVHCGNFTRGFAARESSSHRNKMAALPQKITRSCVPPP